MAKLYKGSAGGTGKLSWCGKRVCAAFLLGAVTAIASPAQTFTSLHSFDNTDGSSPSTSLIQAIDGNLYGTTSDGGLYNGPGTAFKITPTGNLTTIYNFCSQSGCADGAGASALVQATDGNLYGTNWSSGMSGWGTAFKITLTGLLTTLITFDYTDGATPQVALIQGADGNFYGTTISGGTHGEGSAFKMTPDGLLTTLHSFDLTEGSPTSPLIQATDGNFYGTTFEGGTYNNGTVFKVTASGTFTTVYSFEGMQGTDLCRGLIQGADGNFYGTSIVDGEVSGYGTVFKLTPGGTLTTLHSFDGTDGSSPSSLIQATDGYFYGTTLQGGTTVDVACTTNGCGTIFKITPSGTLTTLYNFCSQSGCTDGYAPAAALVQDTNGRLYGTTSFGGTSGNCLTYGCGTVFSLAVGLSPFIETNPGSGKVGAGVKILGTELTGATSVTFNGTAAVFHVVSSSLITTAVPVGATSGKVQVLTPKRTLSSNVRFQVK